MHSFAKVHTSNSKLAVSYYTKHKNIFMKYNKKLQRLIDTRLNIL